MTEKEMVPREDFIKLKTAKESLEDELAALKKAAIQMLGAIRVGAFIIPNRGTERDRSTAAYDGLLAALDMKPSDLAKEG